MNVVSRKRRVKHFLSLKFRVAQLHSAKGFGERLAQERREKAVRDRRDLTQKDVAEAVHTSRPTVSRWEAGGPPPGSAMIERLARYFGVTPGWLLFGQEPRFAERHSNVEHPPEIDVTRSATAAKKTRRRA